MAANLGNPAVATELEKSVFIPIPKKESKSLGQSPGSFISNAEISSRSKMHLYGY